MKKFWKNLCLGALAVTSVVGFSGCGKDDKKVSKDLDGDNVISEWETLFESMSSPNRLMTTNIVEISSLDELKAINNSSEIKVYKLAKNIDCKGETLSINLGQSSFYGNNKVISNFKLDDCNIFSENENSNKKVKGLFYNGVAVYDLRLFMGLQSYDINDDISNYTISPFINVPILDTVTVKGKISIKRAWANGLGKNKIYTSLLASSVEDKVIDLSISKCSVIGDIFLDDTDAYTDSYVGGIVPYLHKNDIVYNCSVNGEINTVSSRGIYTGLVAGESDGFVSTVTTTGTIYTSYHPNEFSYVGGIVGKNNRNAEIKNATTTAEITFDQDLTTSAEPEYMAGGIAGRNDGVISYSTSDAKLNINNCVKAYLGGIAGYGEHAIYYNIISRGQINPKNIKTLFISDMVGYSKYGYIEKAIVNTNITVDNSAIDSKVYLGLVTIFEDFEEKTDLETKYNAEFTPNFKGILVGGTTNVYMKSALSSEDFKYNLGLRNEYEYYEIDEENGGIKRVPVLDKDGNFVYDENDEQLFEFVTDRLVPYVFNNLYLLDTYKLNKYKVTDGQNVLETGLNLTYAKDGAGVSLIESSSSSRVLQLSFFVSDLGFKCGLGHNEIELSEFDLNKIKFTINKDQQLERYFRFDNKKYNGELSSFDKEFEKACTYDLTDEMFSYLNSLISSTTTREYSAIKVSKDFATSEEKRTNEENPPIGEETPSGGEEDIEGDVEEGVDGEEGVEGEEGEDNNEEEVVDEKKEDPLTVSQRFSKNIAQLLKLMKIECSIQELAADFSTISIDEVDKEVKYVRIAFMDDKYSYVLTFDVTEMTNAEKTKAEKPDDPEMNNDVDSVQDHYILYFKYEKTGR